MTWTLGSFSRLKIPIISSKKMLVVADVFPHVHKRHLPQQSLTFSCGSKILGDFSLRKRCQISFIVDLSEGKYSESMLLDLSHLNSKSPSELPESTNRDTRKLGVAFKSLQLQEVDAKLETIYAQIQGSASGLHCHTVGTDVLPQLSVPELLGRFHSGGDDCEFGLLQRRTGRIEPLGLLRFSTISVANLILAIESEFSNIATDESFAIMEYTNDPEHDYMGVEKNYGLLYHTGRRPGEMSKETLRVSEPKRLRFLARMFIQDLEEGDKILIVKSKDIISELDVARLFVAVRARGNSTLLWIAEAKQGQIPGAAYKICPGLIKGYVDRIDTAPLSNISSRSWVNVCRAALYIRESCGSS